LQRRIEDFLIFARGSLQRRKKRVSAAELAKSAIPFNALALPIERERNGNRQSFEYA
jgi:hypothetical protein